MRMPGLLRSFIWKIIFLTGKVGVPLEQLVRKVMWQFEHCKPQMDVEADFFSKLSGNQRKHLF